MDIFCISGANKFLCRASPHPTSLAFIHIDGGEPVTNLRRFDCPNNVQKPSETLPELARMLPRQRRAPKGQRD